MLLFPISLVQYWALLRICVYICPHDTLFTHFYMFFQLVLHNVYSSLILILPLWAEVVAAKQMECAFQCLCVSVLGCFNVTFGQVLYGFVMCCRLSVNAVTGVFSCECVWGWLGGWVGVRERQTKRIKVRQWAHVAIIQQNYDEETYRKVPQKNVPT